MSNIWFTSDTHFWHNSVLEFCPETRQGGTGEEMTEIMVENWNKVVSPNDLVYHAGDFSFGGKAKVRNILGRVNGKIHLTLGNHDFIIKKTKEFQERFETISQIKFFKVGDVRFAMSHYPQAEWWDCHKGVYHVHGHLHGNKTNVEHLQSFRAMDIGIDTRDDNLMIPYHIDEVLHFLKDRDIMTHHD